MNDTSTDTCLCGQWPRSEYGERCPSCPPVEAAPDHCEQSDIDALFELVPGAKNALQGMDVANVNPIWVLVVEAANYADDEPVSREEARIRTANVLRVLHYGERVG